MKQKYSATGAEALFASAFVYALTAILVREVAPMWGDKAQVAVRFVLVLLLLSGYSLLRKHKATVPKAKLPLVVALGLAFAIMVLLFTSAIGKTTIANVLFVFYGSNMIASFIAGTILLKENVTIHKVLALAFAIAGLALYSGAIEQGSLGIIFSLIAGLFGGAMNVWSKLLTGVNRHAVIVTQYAVASLLVLLVTFLSGDEIVRAASWHGALLTVLFAAVIIAGSKLVLYGFQNFDVNIGSVIMSSELVFAAVMGYFFFNEVPAPHEILGGAIIFAGSIIGSGMFNQRQKLDRIL